MLTEIKRAQLQARKSRDALTSSLLTTLIGEAEMVGKNANRATTDAEVLAVVRKFIKNIDETTSAFLSSKSSTVAQDRIEWLKAERAVLENFLPKQLTQDELVQHVQNIVAGVLGMKSQVTVGDVMSVLKNRFEGQYDGKLASIIVKNVVSSVN